MDSFHVPHLPIRELIRLRWQQALSDHDGNRTRAASDLGVSVRTLQRWIREETCDSNSLNADPLTHLQNGPQHIRNEIANECALNDRPLSSTYIEPSLVYAALAL